MGTRIMDIGTDVAFMAFVALNLIVTAAYVAAELLWVTEPGTELRRGLWPRALVMALVPGVSLMYLLLGWAFRRLVFRRPVNLVDVVFSKEREGMLTHAEEEKERNLVPIQDAILISDVDSRRGLFMDVIKFEPTKALYSISLALDSDDAELAHYAASVLQSELGKASASVREGLERLRTLEARLGEVESEGMTLVTPEGARFRDRLAGRSADEGAGAGEAAEAPGRRTYYADISPALEESDDYVRHDALAALQGRIAQGREEGPGLVEELQAEMASAHELIAQIHLVLSQDLLSRLESASYVDSLDEIARIVDRRDVLRPIEIAQCVRYNLGEGRVGEATAWSDLAFEYYPGELPTHAARIKLRYRTDNREGFFEAMDALKASGIPLDKETLEIVRFFN